MCTNTIHNKNSYLLPVKKHQYIGDRYLENSEKMHSGIRSNERTSKIEGVIVYHSKSLLRLEAELRRQLAVDEVDEQIKAKLLTIFGRKKLKEKIQMLQTIRVETFEQ